MAYGQQSSFRMLLNTYLAGVWGLLVDAGLDDWAGLDDCVGRGLEAGLGRLEDEPFCSSWFTASNWPSAANSSAESSSEEEPPKNEKR